MFGGVVIACDSIGTRPGCRYRVVLLDGLERVVALVYLRHKETDEAFEVFLWCYLHRSLSCQCCAAVKRMRHDAHIDTDEKES